jgi:hypothetical protein
MSAFLEVQSQGWSSWTFLLLSVVSLLSCSFETIFRLSFRRDVRDFDDVFAPKCGL